MGNGISSLITEEANFFVISVIVGGAIAVVYDTLRVFRKVICHNNFVVSMEDFLFWIVTGISIFCLQYYENNGTFRIFSIMAVLVGMGIYYQTISKLYFKVVSSILEQFVKVNCSIIKRIDKICKTARKRERKLTGFLQQRMKLFFKIVKNRLTMCKKVIRVTLGSNMKK